MGVLQVQQGLIGSDEGPRLEGLLVGGGRPGTPEVKADQDDAEEGENGKKMHGDFLRVYKKENNQMEEPNRPLPGSQAQEPLEAQVGKRPSRAN